MSKRIYYPKADTMMYVSQLNNPHTGEYWVDVDGVKKMLDGRLGSTLIDYAFIIHDRDTVTEKDIEDRNEQRLNYLAREYHMALGLDMTKQDLQNFAVSEELHSDALKKAQAIVDAKLPQFVLGATKPAHIHIVLRLRENRKTDVVGRWFEQVAPTQPELLKVFKDNAHKSGDRLKNALLYLVHKNAPEKFQYEPSDVKASFDYCTELEKLLEKAALHALYRVTPDEVNDALNAISAGLKTRRDFIKEYSYAVYARNSSNVDKAERHRIAHFAVPPKCRIVGYFDSEMDDKARIGKTTGAYEISRRIAIEKYGAPPEEYVTIEAVKCVNPYVFTASSQTLFEGYTGQPILVLDDFRAGDLKNAFKSRAAIKTFLDPHPGSQRYNIKFDSVLPTPEFIFISGIDSFRTFIESLAGTKAKGEEEEKDMISQFYGRFWFRCTFLDATRYCIYKNREFYPAKCTERFYSTISYLCSVPALMHSSLPDKEKAKLLERGFTPAYEEIMKFADVNKQALDLKNFFELFGQPAASKYDGYDVAVAAYDDSKDATWDSVTPDMPEGTYISEKQIEAEREAKKMQETIDAYVARGGEGPIIPDGEDLPFPPNKEEESSEDEPS